MTIKQQGGIFGRNPTFNDVEVQGDLTVGGSALPSGANTARLDTAQTFTAKQDIVFAGGANYVLQLQNTTSATPYGVWLRDAASSSAGYPLLYISDSTGSNAFLRVDSGNGNVTLGTGNLVIGTSGQGIDFSATSGTGTSELFDDYEEGTWTPVVTNSGGTTYTGAWTNLYGYYTKIGNVVFVSAYLEPSSSYAVGGPSDLYRAARISGLPFTVSASTKAEGAMPIHSASGVTFSGMMVSYAVPNTTFCAINEITSNAGVASITGADLDNGTGGRVLAFSGCYNAA